MLKEFPWSLSKIEVLIVELEHAGRVFPGTRSLYHVFTLFYVPDDACLNCNVNRPDALCPGGRCTTFSSRWASSTPAASVGTISSSDIIIKYDYKG